MNGSADVRMHPRSHTPNPGPRLPRHPSRQTAQVAPAAQPAANATAWLSDDELQELIERAALVLEDKRQRSDYLDGFRDGVLLGALAAALLVLGGIATGLSMGWL